MTKTIIICFLGLIIASPTLAQVPYEVGGFRLGGHINDFADRVKMATAIPIRYQEYLSEVEIKDFEAFKSGLITFGTCQAAGRIVRIKLKYADSSERFFNQLVDRITARYGKPDEWRGDSFGIVKAWKWSFRDGNGNRISLNLQHNTRDDEEKMGNAIKMTMHNLVEEERLCYEKRQAGRAAKDAAGRSKPAGGKTDWDLLVPKQ
jgi:hypothetical protein